jgi:hypothetical protein
MIETLIVFGVVGLLVLLGAMAISLQLDVLLIVAGTCVAIGCVLGLPAGVLYHLTLYRCLIKRGAVTRDFVWHPTRYHALLRADEARRVMPWFALGAFGFGLIILGSLIFMLGFLRL